MMSNDAADSCPIFNYFDSLVNQLKFITIFFLTITALSYVVSPFGWLLRGIGGQQKLKFSDSVVH